MFIAYFSINEGCYKSGEGYWLIGSGVELEFNVEVLFIHPILINYNIVNPISYTITIKKLNSFQMIVNTAIF